MGGLAIIGRGRGRLPGRPRRGHVHHPRASSAMLRHLRGGRWSASPTTGSRCTRQRSLGLNKRAKLGGQLVVAVGFAVVCVTWLKVDTHLSFTRYNSLHIDLGKVGWVHLRRAGHPGLRPTPST